MGVISCPDCKGMVSDAVDTCPHCGRRVTLETMFAKPKVRRASQGLMVGVGLLILGVIAVAIVLASKLSSGGGSNDEAVAASSPASAEPAVKPAAVPGPVAEPATCEKVSHCFFQCASDNHFDFASGVIRTCSAECREGVDQATVDLAVAWSTCLVSCAIENKTDAGRDRCFAKKGCEKKKQACLGAPR